MSYATIKVKNNNDVPVYIQLTADDSHTLLPKVETTLKLVEPVSIYYILQYAALSKQSGLDFKDSEGTLITPENLPQIELLLDAANGVPPYRDLPVSGALETFVDEVTANKEASLLPEVEPDPEIVEGDEEGLQGMRQAQFLGDVVSPEDEEGIEVAEPQTLEDEVDTSVQVEAKGTILVKYVDEDALAISEEEVLEDVVGAKHVVKPKSIEGYNSPSPTQKTVTIVEGVTEVEFVYKSNE